MTTDPEPLVRPYPMPSERIRTALWNLINAEEGIEDEDRLGEAALLPRPWDIASCTDPELRHDVWVWYAEFVTWFNHEYVWDPAAGMIPPCWPQHPHLIHEIGVLADQRRVAATATNSNSLEEWHRLIVPDFLVRMHDRTRQHCDERHQSWPARARYARQERAAGTTQAPEKDVEVSPKSGTEPKGLPRDPGRSEPPRDGAPQLARETGSSQSRV